MWTTLAKLLFFMFLRNRFNVVKQHVKQDVSEVKGHFAVYAASRAGMFKRNLAHDLHRVVNSFIGYLMMFAAIIFAGLTGIMWIVASVWSSPHRDIILGTTMTIPLLLAVGIYFFIHHSWNTAPLLDESFKQIEQDWRAFGHSLDGTADTSEEANA